MAVGYRISTKCTSLAFIGSFCKPFGIFEIFSQNLEKFYYNFEIFLQSKKNFIITLKLHVTHFHQNIQNLLGKIKCEMC